MESGLEILEAGNLNVRRSNAEELRRIREGSLSYEGLLEKAARLEEAMKRAAARTNLPHEVDRRFVDELFLRLVRERGFS